MVKKRNRDPEVLAEAPQVDEDGSDGDTVSPPYCSRTPHVNQVSGHDRRRIRMVQL